MARPSSKSGKTFYIFSTLTGHQKYTNYIPGGDLPIVSGEVFIKGGFGLAQKGGLTTSLGVYTEVSEEEMAILEANSGFRAHVEAGFITVRAGKADAEAVCADMKHGDGSSPLNDLAMAKEDPDAKMTWGQMY